MNPLPRHPVPLERRTVERPFRFRRAEMLGVAAALLLPILQHPLAAGGPGAEAPAVIRLWPTAVVTGDRVVLDDIAQILPGGGDLPDGLRACRVTAAPAAGSATVITIRDIAAALADAGVNPTSVLLRGSSRCLVSRPAIATDSATATTRPATSNADGGTDGTASRPSADVPTAPDSLEQAVREFLSAKLAGLGGAVQVRFSPAVRKALALTRPLYDFRIRQRDGETLGLVSLEADVLENGRVMDTVPIVAEVALLKPVVVARTPINRGEVIEAKHLMLMEQRFVRVSDIGVTELASVIGQEATRFVERGSMLNPRDVKVKPLVRRGDLVTVWVRNGDLVVKSVAKALAAGSYGETVQVKNEATNETFPVTVTGPQTAEAGERPPAGLVVRPESQK